MRMFIFFACLKKYERSAAPVETLELEAFAEGKAKSLIELATYIPALWTL